MNSELSAKWTLWCCRILGGAIGVISVLFPEILGWYAALRSLEKAATVAITAGFYLCVPVVLYALWSMDRLVRNLLKKQVFVTENVRHIRHIRWCCAGVSGICLAPGILYQPLLLMTVIMAFLALVVSLVKNIMAAAVELREENDLTV